MAAPVSMAGIARELTGSGANKLGNGLVGVGTDLRHIAGKLSRRVLSMIEAISAVTLGTHEMPRAVRFYRALGFEAVHGDEQSSFTSFRAGMSYLNLVAQPTERRASWWGRVVFYVADVDALYERALARGCQPTTAPRDAEWGERFFHLIDPDGHELSFARPLLSSV